MKKEASSGSLSHSYEPNAHPWPNLPLRAQEGVEVGIGRGNGGQPEEGQRPVWRKKEADTGMGGG